jgi:hypothetical protein
MDRQDDQNPNHKPKSDAAPTPPKPAPFQVLRRRVVFPKAAVPLSCDCGGCACFPAGTLVLMADGSQKPIERVRLGDRVWGLSGINNVVTVETPVLGTRTMLQMSDGSLRYSAEHPLWTLSEGAQWWGTHDNAEAEWEIAQGVFGGLTRSEPLRPLAREGATYAHVDGWKTLGAVEVPASSHTRLYHLDTDGCHTKIVDGFVVSAGIDDADFDYSGVVWRGLQALRAVMQAGRRIARPEVAASAG